MTSSSVPITTSPSTLSAQIAHLRASLHLPALSLALHAIPAHLTLPLLHVLPELHITPIHLNPRWTLRESARAAISAHANAILLVAPNPTLQSLLPLPTLILNPATLCLIPLTSAIIRPHTPPHPPSHIFFTSGTTASPKPVLISHSTLLLQSRTKILLLNISSTTNFLHLTPLHTVGGVSAALAISLAQATHIFPPPHLTPSKHPISLLRLLHFRNVSLLIAVPTVLQLLLDAALASSPPSVVPSLRTILYGAASLHPRLLDSLPYIFPAARIIGAYGMTEAASSITFIDHSALLRQSCLHASVGWPPAHVQVRVVPGREGGEQIEGSGIGEIWTRGPHLMTRYLAKEGGLEEDGWFRTGDLGYIDKSSGALFVVGRRKDMIKTGGENVFAREVEELLLGCDGVRDAAVVGLPHRVLGEAVAAAVVLIQERREQCKSEALLEQLGQVCREHLSGFKRPKWIWAEPELPRNTMGKIVKGKLKEVLSRRLTTADRIARL